PARGLERIAGRDHQHLRTEAYIRGAHLARGIGGEAGLDLRRGIRPIDAEVPGNVVAHSYRARHSHRRGRLQLRRTAADRITLRRRVAVVESGVIDSHPDVRAPPGILAHELVLD